MKQIKLRTVVVLKIILISAQSQTLCIKGLKIRRTLDIFWHAFNYRQWRPRLTLEIFPHTFRDWRPRLTFEIFPHTFWDWKPRLLLDPALSYYGFSCC